MAAPNAVSRLLHPGRHLDHSILASLVWNDFCRKNHSCFAALLPALVIRPRWGTEVEEEVCRIEEGTGRRSLTELPPEQICQVPVWKSWELDLPTALNCQQALGRLHIYLELVSVELEECPGDCGRGLERLGVLLTLPLELGYQIVDLEGNRARMTLELVEVVNRMTGPRYWG